MSKQFLETEILYNFEILTFDPFRYKMDYSIQINIYMISTRRVESRLIKASESINASLEGIVAILISVIAENLIFKITLPECQERKPMYCT